MTAAEIASALGGARREGREWRCLCPVHDDHNPSLSLEERDGKLLVKRRAHCDQDAVIAALRQRDLWPESEPAAERRRIVAVYSYRDDRGALRFQVVRYAPKDFKQRRPNGSDDQFIWNMREVEPLPYRLPELLADPDATVFVCEGEKDADNLGDRGFVTTSNHGGAGKWRSEISHWLAGRNVVILPHNDEPGRAHADDVARKLAGIAASVRILELPNLPPKGGDVSNWLAAGGTAEELERLAAEAPEPDEYDAKTKEPLLLPVNPATLEGLPVPERHWLVPHWIPMSRATSLYGGGGEGKTLLAQLLATACAIEGGKWVGLPVKRCNVLLFFCEDDIKEMHRRQADINAYYRCTFADLDAMRWLPRLGDDNTLMVFDNGRACPTPLFDQLLSAAKDHHAELVVTDTLADIFAGDENDRGQSRLFAQSALGHLARQTGAASLTLAHPSLSGSAKW
jgi:hypothetical protein